MWFSLKRKPCRGIEAQFYYGPQRCGVYTRRRLLFDRRFYPFCKEHLHS